MSDSAYINLTRGTRLESYLGLVMSEGKDYRLGRDYMHVDIPLGEVLNPAQETLIDPEQIKGNMRLCLIPACTIKVRDGYRVQVDPHPSLLDVADLSWIGTVDPVQSSDEEQYQPRIWATFRKSADLSDLPYLLRFRVIG